MKRQFLLALILPWSANAGGIGGPIVGYVPEPAAQAVRPILGIPGASLMGERLTVGLEMRAAAVSPQQDYMLVVSADGSASVIDLRDTPVARAIEGVRASRIALSPNGATAVLSGHNLQVVPGCEAATALQIIKNLPSQPSVASVVEACGIGAFAVSDDGAVLFESGGTLFSAAPGGEARPVPFAGQVSLIAFLEGTRDALIAGRDDNQVALVRDVTGTPTYRRLAGATEGIDAPLGLAFTKARALVANRNSVVAIDVETGAAATTACGCTVTGLERMRGAAIYRASDFGAGPLWLFDAAENRFLFVPAPAEEVAQ